MRTGELTHKIFAYYGTKEGSNSGKYIVLTQVRAATGWDDPSTADVMVMGNWPSSGNELMGFEVKVSRSDWLNEVKNAEKCAPTKKYCNRWWLVIADETMVKEGELPEDWGMMAIVNNKIKVIKEAPKLIAEPLSHKFVASMLRSDAKETIPIDVHNDQIKDIKRQSEAEHKEKYTALLKYVQFLNKELGINIELREETKWENGKYQKFFKEWATAVPKNRFGYYGHQKVVEIIKAALADDLEGMRNKMDSIERYAQQIINISEQSKEVIHES